MNKLKLKIKIIIGSIRQGRFGDKPAKWIFDIANKSEGAKDNEYEILDLKDYQLPMFAEGTSPAYVEGKYPTDVVNAWAAKIAEADGFIIVAAEYNHGYTSSLKNNLDYLYKEWNNKPVAFVAYGSAGGARAVEQLRQVAVELQMAPTRSAVHIMSPWDLTNDDDSLKDGALDKYTGSAEGLLKQLSWWSKTLKAGREGK